MILVCEPLCTGHEHVEFNAALIAVLRNAFPDDAILFFAERDHLEMVRVNLKKHRVGNIEYNCISIPARDLWSYQRLARDRAVCNRILQTATQKNIRHILFTSVMSSCLVSLKILLRRHQQIDCVVVLHSILESALKKRPSLQPFKLRSYLEIPFWFRLPLLYGNSKRLRYLLLGASVQEQICKKFPKLRPFTGVIDIPCFYKEPAAFTPFEHRTIRFASLGVGVKDKGIDLFFRLAKDLQELKSQYRAEFVHIGPLGRKIACLKNEFVQIPSGDTVLSRNDYDRHIASIDYVVLLHKPDAYKVSPSATIFDAFSHLKPIVAMQNPFFEHYFEQMGDIGYLCADYNKVKSVVKYIICETPLQQYLKQREAISKGREMLNIAELARKIKSAW